MQLCVALWGTLLEFQHDAGSKEENYKFHCDVKACEVVWFELFLLIYVLQTLTKLHIGIIRQDEKLFHVGCHQLQVDELKRKFKTTNLR